MAFTEELYTAVIGKVGLQNIPEHTLQEGPDYICPKDKAGPAIYI